VVTIDKALKDIDKDVKGLNLTEFIKEVAKGIINSELGSMENVKAQQDLPKPVKKVW